MEQSHPGTRSNMGQTERALSAIAGSLLLYAITKKHKGHTLLLGGGVYLLYRAISGHCPVSNILHKKEGGARNINIRTSLIVNRPRAEVYATWRKLENLPTFMKHLDSVDEIDRLTSAWRLKFPGGLGEVRWEATIVKDERNSELSWRSVPKSSMENAGKIHFSDAPGGGTRMVIMISYRAPFGVIGERIARLLTPAFRDLLEKDIQNFKFFMEDRKADIPLT
jgi:uncharacterized membrane protein